MALLYQAELRPSKIEIIEAWAPAQPWFEGSRGASLTSVGSFRFDDPDGEVGIETILVGAGDGRVLQVPLTYRGAPLEAGEAWLIGTTEHSVLGRRWVYDATGDPAYLTAVATAALTGGSQAEQHIDIDGVRVIREPTAVVVGSGKDDGPGLSLALSGTVTTRHDRGATVVETSTLRLVVVRVLTEQDHPSQDSPSQDSSRSAVLDDHAFTAVLTGTWTNQTSPRTLVQVQAR